jgi:hypothetical protein
MPSPSPSFHSNIFFDGGPPLHPPSAPPPPSSCHFSLALAHTSHIHACIIIAVSLPVTRISSVTRCGFFVLVDNLVKDLRKNNLVAQQKHFKELEKGPQSVSKEFVESASPSRISSLQVDESAKIRIYWRSTFKAIEGRKVVLVVNSHQFPEPLTFEMETVHKNCHLLGKN